MPSSVLRADRVHEIERLAQRALERYPPALRGSAALICLSENATLRIDTRSGSRYVLRLHRQGYHSPAAIESELAWLRALDEAGLEVPRPLDGVDGSALQLLELANGSIQPVVMFEWIEGDEPHPDEDLESSFIRLGELNARLHAHSRGWTPPAGFLRPRWDHAGTVGADALWGDWRCAPWLSAAGREVIEQCIVTISARLTDYGEGPQRFGLIHADPRLANLLIDGASTRIIDFDDCGHGWFLHDLASALSFHEHHPKARRWIDAWLEGYARIGRLEDDDLAALPSLIVQRRLQLLAWTGTRRGTDPVTALGPGWVAETEALCRRYLGRGDPLKAP
ncbi:phosphotransferase enzyme family protein [Halotalea alkalilenta]|uniref:Aminoglycoside phosphotransferase domain-containing protein n=1 Tax=Halotalea alkalilenta TaxID=376489 RepID=A0A172YIQ0_9GAMM|nr:phosphotransferase [Halotalea alkalilenta]ANF59088.1 hypothetical protein A5892_17805 [Halotalea alkalilenta]